MGKVITDLYSFYNIIDKTARLKRAKKKKTTTTTGHVNCTAYSPADHEYIYIHLSVLDNNITTTTTTTSALKREKKKKSYWAVYAGYCTDGGLKTNRKVYIFFNNFGPESN